jgi:cell division transport system permease protein
VMRKLIERTVRGISNTPGLFLTTTAAVAVSLVLVGAFVLALIHGRAWASTLAGAETLVAYLRPEVDGKGASQIAADISALPVAAKVELESPEAAAQRMRLVLGEKEDVVLDAALTWSITVSADEPEHLAALAQAVSAVAGVDEVDFGQSVYERLRALGRVAFGFGVALLLLVTIVCVFVVNIAVSLALFVRREEISVQRIIGASDGFILGPLLLEGAIAGTLGGAVALSSLYALFGAFTARYGEAIAALSVAPPRFFDFTLGAGIVLAGIAIACFGSLLASFRYLRQAE